MATTTTSRPGEQLGTGQRLMLLILLDVSSSMKGEPIRRLLDALKSWLAQMSSHELAGRLDVAMVAFGDGRARVLNLAGGSSDPADVEAFVPITAAKLPTSGLVAAGDTPLGLAISRALALLPVRKSYLRANNLNYYRPLVWVLTDGMPNDAWEAPASSLRDAEDGDHAITFAVGFGQADRAVLARLAPDAHFMVDNVNFEALLRLASGSAEALARGASAAEVKQQVQESVDDIELINAWLNQPQVP